MEDKNVGGTETEEAKRLVTLPTGVVQAVPTPGGIVDRLPSAEEAGPGTSLLEDPSNVAALTKKERQVLKKKQLDDLPALRDDVGAYGVLAEDDEEERGATSRTDSEMEDKAVRDAGGDGVGDMKGDGVDDTGGDDAGDAGGDSAGGTWADIVASSSTETEDKAVGDTGGDGVGDKRGRSVGGTGGDGVGDTGGDGVGDTGGDGSGDTGGDYVGDTSGDGAGDTGEDGAGPTWADIVASPSTETEDKGGVGVGDTGGDGVGDTRGDGAGDTGGDGFGHDVGGTWPGEVASQSTETEETKRLVTLPTGVVEAVPTPGGVVDSLPSAEETGPGTSLGEDPFNVAALTKKERKVLKKKQLGDSLALRDDIGAYGVLAEDDDEQRGATSGTDSETEGKAVDDTGGDGVEDGAGGTWADKVAPPSTETNEKGDDTGDTGGDGARDTGGDADDTWADMGAPPPTETEETKRLVTLPTGVVQAVPTPGGIVDRLPSAEETGPGTSLGEDPYNVAALTKKERKVLKQKQLGDLDALQDAIGGYGVLAEDDEEEREATSRTDSEMEDKAVGDTGGDGAGNTGGDGAGDTRGNGVGDTGGDGGGATWADIVAPPSTETEDKGGDGVGDSGGDGAGDTGGDGATWAGIVASPSTETEKTKRLVTLPTGVAQAVATPEGIVDSLPSAEETGPGTSMSMDPSNIMALSKKERKVLQQKQLGDLDALHDEIGANAKGHKQG